MEVIREQENYFPFNKRVVPTQVSSLFKFWNQMFYSFYEEGKQQKSLWKSFASFVVVSVVVVPRGR